MSLPLVNILIPVYNTESYLDKCIESVSRQTYKNFNIVTVIDGCSNDLSKYICEDYSKKLNNFEYYQIEQSGVSATRGELLKHLTGKYSIFIDSDDWVDPDMIESLVKCCESENLDFIESKIYNEGIINKANKADPVSDPILKIYKKDEALHDFFNSGEIRASLCTKMINNDILGKLNFEQDINYAEDLLLSWRLMHHANKIGSINRAFYHYQRNPDSVTHQKFNKEHMALDKVWDIIVYETNILYPNFYDDAKRNKLTADIWLLYYALKSKEQNDSIINTLVYKIKGGLKSVEHKSKIHNKKLFFGMFVTKFSKLLRWIMSNLNRYK